MGRFSNAGTTEGYDFSVQMVSNTATFPSKSGACDYFLRVIGDDVPSSVKSNAVYRERKELVNVIYELFTPDDEVIVTHRMNRPVMRLSFDEATCEAVNQARDYYERFVASRDEAVKWRVFAPIGLTVQAYYWKTRWRTNVTE